MILRSLCDILLSASFRHQLVSALRLNIALGYVRLHEQGLDRSSTAIDKEIPWLCGANPVQKQYGMGNKGRHSLRAKGSR